MAENAYNNGVEFKFDTEVKNIRKQEKGFVVETSKGDLETGCIVNAAGVYADVFHNMVSEKNCISLLVRVSICSLIKVQEHM